MQRQKQKKHLDLNVKQQLATSTSYTLLQAQDKSHHWVLVYQARSLQSKVKLCPKIVAPTAVIVPHFFSLFP